EIVQPTMNLCSGRQSKKFGGKWRRIVAYVEADHPMNADVVFNPATKSDQRTRGRIVYKRREIHQWPARRRRLGCLVDLYPDACCAIGLKLWSAGPAIDQQVP